MRSSGWRRAAWALTWAGAAAATHALGASARAQTPATPQPPPTRPLVPIAAPPAPPASPPAPLPPPPRVVLPLDRQAYIVGEQVPLAAANIPADGRLLVEARGADGVVTLYKGKPAALLLDTARLAPGDYQLLVNGTPTGQRLFVVSPIRRSAAALTDEATPRDPAIDHSKKPTPAQIEAIKAAHWDQITNTLRETGLTSCVALGASDMGRSSDLDTMARVGAMLLVNPDTRPTSFLPVSNQPREIESMSQRVMLTAQANARYPNFGGFCFGWDTAGYAPGNRRMLLVYWSWGDKADLLRRYIDGIDRYVAEEFTRRTGLAPATDAEYIAYCLAVGRPEFAPAVDLPTRLWLDEIARHVRPMGPEERAKFERRLDAWSGYLMGIYEEGYKAMSANLGMLGMGLRHTSSVQVDHAPVRVGQYLPAAYRPLDFRYQSTWNDQVGGPDYAYQWLFTAAMLDMERTGPTWISSVLAEAHGRAPYSGKFARIAAHNLALGGSGIGMALEGFSNVLGGMNSQTHWANMKGGSGQADLDSGRDFLDRFAVLATQARGDHGVEVLYSRSQYKRQHVYMGFGTTPYKAMVTLTRLGYTPRLITEDEIAARGPTGKALLVLGQTVPLERAAAEGIARFASAGGRVLIDGSTSIELPGVAKVERIDYAFPFAHPGKPHSWGSPNMPRGENDLTLVERWHRELAPALAKALGDTGRGIFKAREGAATRASVIQIHAGADARFVVVVNDSSVATQADWRQIRERLIPVAAPQPGETLYDCTDEKDLGSLGEVDCDLTRSTVRVLAVLRRPMQRIELKANQKVDAGEEVGLRVRFLDAAGAPIKAVLPFQVTLARPDGSVQGAYYRGTDAQGSFAMRLPLGVNAPTGQWKVSVRSQLHGQEATVPVQVGKADDKSPAQAAREPVWVRGREAAERVLARGGKVVLPVFDGPDALAVLAVARRAQELLAKRGVSVEIREKPAVGAYTIAYENSEAEAAENARVERGELIGKISRKTLNGNDWYAGAGGYRLGATVLLLDLAGKKDNPMAEAMEQFGALWPAVDASFPGQGGAVVNGLDWVFWPGRSALVIQASSVEGLAAGVESLRDLPKDRLTASVRAARERLLGELAIGRDPRAVSEEPRGLSDKGYAVESRPRPFVIAFPAATPPTDEEAKPPVKAPREALPVPGEYKANQLVTYMLDGQTWVEAGTAGMLVPDLRFSQGLMLIGDVKTPGRHRLVVDGLFRFSERKPMWQAQWEDIIELREKLVPKERLAMEIEVFVGRKSVGKLLPSKTGNATVQLELRSPTGGKPRTAEEEAVQQIAGEIDLPAGRQEILLVHRNMIDGRVEKVTVAK